MTRLSENDETEKSLMRIRALNSETMLGHSNKIAGFGISRSGWKDGQAWDGAKGCSQGALMITEAYLCEVYSL